MHLIYEKMSEASKCGGYGLCNKADWTDCREKIY